MEENSAVTFYDPNIFKVQLVGQLLRFSGIANQEKQETIVSAEFRNGELLVTSANAAKPADRTKLAIRHVDPTHLDVKIFAPLPALRFEKSGEEKLKLANDWDATRSYAEEDFIPDNAQMKSILDADQADRKNGLHIDWSVVSKADERRRRETLALLRENKLHTGNDFEGAAFVFQHGSAPDDYLLAHTLAMDRISDPGPLSAIDTSAADFRDAVQYGRQAAYNTRTVQSGTDTGFSAAAAWDSSVEGAGRTTREI